MAPERDMRFLKFRFPLVAVLALASSGCAQLGFLSGGFFDRGPTVLSSCAQKAPETPSPTGEAFVRPADCDSLDQAKSNLNNGNYAAAEEKYKSSVETFTLDETRRADLRAAWFGLAAAYDNQRRFAEADKAYAMIKSSFGEDVRYFNNYGYSLYLRGNFAEAEKQFRSALAIKPNDERILANLEMVAASTAKPQAAPVDETMPVPFIPGSGEAQPSPLQQMGGAPQ